MSEPTIREIERKRLWRRMALTDIEYRRIVQVLGRKPNYTELGMFAVLWSEHCAYKHSKLVLKKLPTTGPRVVQGPGENAGVVDIGHGLAIAFKEESHNHPSAIEPFQGAATGVGGIVRDILAMGARPIAILDSLRFGPPQDPRTRYLMGGVVAGIAAYGNSIGVPTVGGEVYFEDSYYGNPLVNVMCLGILEKSKLARGIASGIGNKVLLVGSRTGRDGIHGATFASEELTEKSEQRRPSVQVGDPFMEKLLIESCLEALETGHVVGIQDLGAAGLTSSSAEMAARAGTGMVIDVALVPKREKGMTPYEVMLSESQERMLLVVKSGAEREVQKVFEKWGLQSTVIGEVTDDGLLKVLDGDKLVARIPVKALTEQAPVYEPKKKKPEYLKKIDLFRVGNVPDLEAERIQETLFRVLASPNVASKRWVYHQYDHMVQLNTVFLPGGDAALLRIKGTPAAIAVSMAGNGRYCYLDPYAGGAIAVAEAARNVVCTGALPIGLTNCLNFGNPEKPEVFWQFEQVVEGISNACAALEIPVTGGNVSFYNESGDYAVYPTPVIGVVGILEDIERRCFSGFVREGDVIAVLGIVRGELGGTEYLKIVHGMIDGSPPSIDLQFEKSIQDACLEAIHRGLINSAHDCSDGGLLPTIAEACFIGADRPGGRLFGAELMMERRERRLDELFFGESTSRIIVSFRPLHLGKFSEVARKYHVPFTVLGMVGGDRFKLTLDGRVVVDVPIAELKRTWDGAIPSLMELKRAGA